MEKQNRGANIGGGRGRIFTLTLSEKMEQHSKLRKWIEHIEVRLIPQ